jgi:hypothetical protein
MPGLVLSTQEQHPRPTIQPQPRQQQQSGARARSQPIDALPTNTLILTSLPAAFFHPSILEPLRDHFMNYGELHTWAPLKGFGRIIAVFWNVEDAERLRQECDGLHVGGPESYVISFSQILRLLSDYSFGHLFTGTLHSHTDRLRHCGSIEAR